MKSSILIATALSLFLSSSSSIADASVITINHATAQHEESVSYSYLKRAPHAYAEQVPQDSPRRNHPSPPTLLNEEDQEAHQQRLEQRRNLRERYQPKPRNEKKKQETVTLTGATSGKTFRFSNRAPTASPVHKGASVTPAPAPFTTTATIETPYSGGIDMEMDDSSKAPISASSMLAPVSAPASCRAAGSLCDKSGKSYVSEVSA